MPAKKLYKHQHEFLKKNPNRALLVWETGTGKTIAACEWLKKRQDYKALVICPKAIVEKWERDLKEWGAKADVVSMSKFSGKNTPNLGRYRALIVDEAQHFAAPLFGPGASQRAKALYTYFRAHPEAHTLLLSATPVRSTPWNIHTLACYLGKFWPPKDFRSKFFYFTDMFGRWHWEKKSGWQKSIRPYVEEISDIVLMSDCVDVPIQHNQIVDIPWTKSDEAMLDKSYKEPSAEWHARHRAENGRMKFNKLHEISEGFRKIIVVCHYTKQIDDYVSWFGEERQVFVLDGRTKDQDKVIQEAREADDCIFIIQASMGAGFDAAEFSVVVFASMSFRYVDYVQMKGRVKRINNLHENTFIHLLGGECDRGVYDTIQENRDFDVHDYLAREQFRKTKL